MAQMRLPQPGQRALIVGRTGSGKTQAALFLLSLMDYDERPWIVLDYKGESNIAQIPGAEVINLRADLWKLEPGIYIIRPQLFEAEAVEKLLWDVWQCKNIGLFIDEGYMLPDRSDAFRAILTQGRSKKISVILLTQRPVAIDRFAISESDYFQIFHLNDKQDRKRVQEYVPYDFDREAKLEPYHSIWYDVAADRLQRLAPVPELGDILTIFRSRLPVAEPSRRLI